MKKPITILIIIFFIIPLAGISLAGEVYTADYIETLLEKQCENVVLMDDVYEDYPLSRALTKADCTNYKYKPNLFDCDDIAYSIKALVVQHVSEITDSGGAVLFGVAFVKKKEEGDSGHVANIAIYEKDIWIYDWQMPSGENIIEIEKYLETNIVFLIIL